MYFNHLTLFDEKNLGRKGMSRSPLKVFRGLTTNFKQKLSLYDLEEIFWCYSSLLLAWKSCYILATFSLYGQKKGNCSGVKNSAAEFFFNCFVLRFCSNVKANWLQTGDFLLIILCCLNDITMQDMNLNSVVMTFDIFY